MIYKPKEWVQHLLGKDFYLNCSWTVTFQGATDRHVPYTVLASERGITVTKSKIYRWVKFVNVYGGSITMTSWSFYSNALCLWAPIP